MTIQGEAFCSNPPGGCWRRVALTGAWIAALAGAAASAFGQEAKDTGVLTRPAQPDEGPVPTADDGAGYLVSQFQLIYGREDLEGQPDLHDEGFQRLTVRLGKTDAGYVAPRAGIPSVDVRLIEISAGAGGVFYRSALQEVCRAVVREFNRRGIYALFVAPSAKDIDEREPYKDLREGRTDLGIAVWLGVVQDVRTVAGGDRKITGERINNPVHAKIRESSPVKDKGLLRKDRLDAYTFALNRHPGRRVDVAVAAADQTGGVQVDYLITENKPWTVFFQISNTGTKNTNEWRERFGFVDNQFTNHDDILRIDYSTAGFDSSQNVALSYEFPLRTNVLRARVFGNYNEFTASDVGQDGAEFTGESWMGGGELIWTVFQHRDLFVDLIGGVRWESVEVNNELLGSQASQDFLLPNIAARLERNTDASHTFAQVGVEFMANDGNQDEMEDLGRTPVSDNFSVMKWDVEQSFYLEPLINPSGGTPDGKGMTLAHEIAVATRGQYAFNNRLIPNFQTVLGGLYTVRGYPESVVVGDDSWLVSVEYRFHLPQALASRDPGKLFGRDFRYAPQGPYGRADWDLILKGFYDIGNVTNSDVEPYEEDQTISGAGIGIELQFLRNVSIRADYGWALEDANSNPATGSEFVESGSSRFHFVATLLY